MTVIKLPVYIGIKEALAIIMRKPCKDSSGLLHTLEDMGLLNPNRNFSGKKFYYLKSEMEEILLMVHRKELKLNKDTAVYLGETA